MFHPRTHLAVILTIAMGMAASGAPKEPPPPRVVQSDRDGRLSYATSDRGDRVPDFSYAGYAGGDREVPDVPVRITVPHRGGDQTARLQSAIDHVSSLQPDANGFRGTVLLAPGRFEIAGGLTIKVSGVVLRGSGVRGEKATVLVASGHDRRTLLTVLGQDDRKVADPSPISDPYVPVNAMTFRVAGASTKFKPGDTILVRRPSTPEWVRALGMNDMGGERHGFSWKPGSRDLAWDRVVTKIDGDTVMIDAPITTALDAQFGGGTVAKYDWPGRITNVGVEHLRCESAYDATNPKDENHSWFAISMEHARDAWVRQVEFAHFAGSAVALWESCSRLTVEDCKSLAPVSEIGGYRRHTFFTAGQQTLSQRCFSEQGRHDFAVGFCAAGPNAFVQCESKDSLDDSGPIDSWASGVLFDNVRIDGNAITFADRRYNAQGAGWSAANSMLWQCHAAVIRCFSPPTAANWAVGCWSTFDGNGVWQSSNESVKPTSLYYAQLGDRVGRDEANARAQLMQIPSDASSSPTADVAAELAAASRQPGPELSKWIDDAAKRNTIPVDSSGAQSVDDLRGLPPTAVTSSGANRIAVRNGWIVANDRLIVGGRTGVMWWRGGVRPSDIDDAGRGVTRFVPGRIGKGLTDDLGVFAANLQSSGTTLLDHNYGLWYDRRRDDHERVRRMNGDVWAPFYEQPFARSGQGVAWDGLSKYDLTKYNPWYWDRLKSFADQCDQRGLVLLHNNYFQHNILEAGAHYADFPWRTANNVNDTGFPEPPPYAGDKRIFLAEPFYDVTHSTRRALHRAYIRKSLDNFVGNSNVIQLTSAEYTGPLHFVEFWLDTIAEWERETGKDAIIGLNATKDVQDAILADPKRSPVVSVIEMEQWWYTSDGGVYDPKGGANLAPRQHQRVWKGPSKRSETSVAKQVRDYRKRFPDKAILVDYDGVDGWAALVAGASVPPIRGKIDPALLAALPNMQPAELPSASESDQWALAEPGKHYLVYTSGASTLRLDLPSANAEYVARWIDPSSGALTSGETVAGGATREFTSAGGGRRVLWVSRK